MEIERLSQRALPAGSRPGRWPLATNGAAGGGPAVLVAVETSVAWPTVVEDVASRLEAKLGLKRERFAVCSTHTHWCLAGP